MHLQMVAPGWLPELHKLRIVEKYLRRSRRIGAVLRVGCLSVQTRRIAIRVEVYLGERVVLLGANRNARRSVFQRDRQRI